MTKFVLTRLFQLVVVVLVVTFVTSVVMSFLPGDPVKVIAPFADNQQREAIRPGYCSPVLERRVGHWFGWVLPLV